MQKLFRYSILVALFISMSTQRVTAQKNNKAVIAGSAIATAIIVKAEIEQMKEILEQSATEFVLANDTISEFELKLIHFDVTKWSDLSNLSAICFSVKPRHAPTYILLLACSKGWVNDFGVNFDFIKTYTITKELWTKMVVSYLQIAGNQSSLNINSIPLYEKRAMADVKTPFTQKDFKEKRVIPINEQNYFIQTTHTAGLANLKDIDGDDFDFEIQDVNRNNKTIILSYPLRSLTGDSYAVADFSSELKLVFNEKDMNIFFKETMNLAKIKRKVVLKITKELYN